ncbi:hypothetical protein [Brachyspira sp.]|uniref:hypothetical protein n=1 Tax=Brachyspira sp. TaxID=1977261 RepID=UPI00262FC510|nr:hypothetical protein [Brachyspira sp.]
MQILISVMINIVILAVTLPLFYIYIVSKARDRLEKETMTKAREEIEALVKEFNNIALSRISILEDSIVRANRLIKELNGFQDKSNKNLKETINEKENKNQKNEQIEVIIEKNDDIKENENIQNENKKLDIRVDDNSVKSNKKEEKDKEEKNTETKTNREEIKSKPKKNNIDTAVKAIDDEARKEVIEKLRSKLDKTIKTNMAIYDKPIEDKTIALVNEPLENSIKGNNKNDDIIRLYKEGLNKEEIAKRLNCSITEIDIVIDLNMN